MHELLLIDDRASSRPCCLYCLARLIRLKTDSDAAQDKSEARSQRTGCLVTARQSQESAGAPKAATIRRTANVGEGAA